MYVARPDGPWAKSASASLPQRFPERLNSEAPCSSSAHPDPKLSASARKLR